MATTPNMGLAFLEEGQAAKHETVNNALLGLDILSQCRVSTRTHTTPSNGSTVIVSDAAGSLTGDVVGHLHDIAYRDANGAMTFYPPAEGWIAYVEDADLLVLFDGTSWGPLQVGQLGINATPDATNKLAVRSGTVLFEDCQLKINKAGGSDIASILFQSGYSGRSEIVLDNSDTLVLKSSSDGVTWVNWCEVTDTAVTFPDGGLSYAVNLNADAVVNADVTFTGAVRLQGLPTSDAGLSSGQLWRDGTTVKVVP